MKKKLLVALGSLLLGLATLGLSAPTIVHPFGLHPTHEGESQKILGKRALVSTTSHRVLNAPGKTELRKAGVIYESATAFRDLFPSHVVVDKEPRRPPNPKPSRWSDVR